MVHIEYVTKLVKLLLHVTSLATQCSAQPEPPPSAVQYANRPTTPTDHV